MTRLLVVVVAILSAALAVPGALAVLRRCDSHRLAVEQRHRSDRRRHLRLRGRHVVTGHSAHPQDGRCGQKSVAMS